MSYDDDGEWMDEVEALLSLADQHVPNRIHTSDLGNFCQECDRPGLPSTMTCCEQCMIKLLAEAVRDLAGIRGFLEARLEEREG